MNKELPSSWFVMKTAHLDLNYGICAMSWVDGLIDCASLIFSLLIFFSYPF